VQTFPILLFFRRIYADSLGAALLKENRFKPKLTLIFFGGGYQFHSAQTLQLTFHALPKLPHWRHDAASEAGRRRSHQSGNLGRLLGRPACVCWWNVWTHLAFVLRRDSGYFLLLYSAVAIPN
jgi:hypothetical protein